MSNDDPILEFENLTVRFSDAPPAVRRVSFEVRRGEMVGIVGESGSGKSVSMLAALGLLPPTARVSGSIRFTGTELIEPTARRLRDVRGRNIAIVFQDPLSALNPSFTIGAQIAESLRLHRPPLSRRERTQRSIDVLADVGLPNGASLLRRFPHELSGGMRQRVLIAVALAGDPEILLADEPTTALDVTLAAEILDLLENLRRERQLAVVLVSHDLNLVASRCGDVVVMFRGEVVEHAKASVVFERPAHPYTRLLAERTLDPFDHRPLDDPPPIAPGPVGLDGCVFASRCPVRIDACTRIAPPTVEVSDEQRASCHLLTGEAAV